MKRARADVKFSLTLSRSLALSFFLTENPKEMSLKTASTVKSSVKIMLQVLSTSVNAQGAP